MARMIGMSLCREILLNKDRFLLYSHKNPDGDTVCSCGALCSALRRAGKTAYLAPNDQVLERYRVYFDPFVMPECCVADYFISVDVASLNQMPESYGGHTDMIIDHHPSNSLFADLGLVNGSKASCGEIVMELIKELCGDITPFEAEMLYVAVSTDTGCFRYANTNADCLRSAAELLDLGVNNGRINVGIFMKMTEAKMKLVGRIYSTLETRKDGLISVVKITDKMIKETGVTENDLEDLASYAGQCETSRVSVTLREKEDGTVKISLRSSPPFNCSDACAIYGGGGHALAAGVSLKAGIDEAEEMILKAVEEVWQ